LQVGHADLVEFDRLDIDTDVAECFGERHGGVLGITHVGSVADDQRKFVLASHTGFLGRAGRVSS
jgi:hypothetical protein